MSAAKEIAEIVGWPHFVEKFGQRVYVPDWYLEAEAAGTYIDRTLPLWQPDADLNHAIQAAELRWPQDRWEWNLMWDKDKKWYVFEVADWGSAYGPESFGDSPAGAICAAIRAAGPRERGEGPHD